MFIICANTIEEAERDLFAMKQAVATGKPIGLGGDTPEDVEQAMKCLRNALSAYTEPCTCGCPCCPEVEDEEEDDGVKCCGCCDECEYVDECDDYLDECDDHEYEEEDENCDTECVNHDVAEAMRKALAYMLGLTD